MFLIQDVKTDFQGCKHLPVPPTCRALEMCLLSTHPADSLGVWLCCRLCRASLELLTPAQDPYLAARCQAAPEIKGEKPGECCRGKVCAQTQSPAPQPACLAPAEPSLALLCAVLSSPAPATLAWEHPGLEGRF